VFDTESITQPDVSEADFRSQATHLLAFAAAILLIPFVANDFFTGQYAFGAGGALVVGILLYNVRLWRQNNSEAAINLFLLIPLVIAVIGLSIVNKGILAVFWSYPALMSFYCMLPVRKAFAANVLLVVVVGLASLNVLPLHLYSRAIGALLASSLFAVIMVYAIEIHHRQLRNQIVTDHLTGVFNRSLLSSTLDSAFRTYATTAKNQTLLSIDIDHFKTINDTFGHADGDIVLASLGRILKTHTRKADYVFRIGGEEFLVLLSGSDKENAAGIAESIRTDVQRLEDLTDHTVTVSIGVAELSDEEHWTVWFRRADKHLYSAKSQGRNRVVVG